MIFSTYSNYKNRIKLKVVISPAYWDLPRRKEVKHEDFQLDHVLSDFHNLCTCRPQCSNKRGVIFRWRENIICFHLIIISYTDQTKPSSSTPFSKTMRDDLKGQSEPERSIPSINKISSFLHFFFFFLFLCIETGHFSVIIKTRNNNFRFKWNLEVHSEWSNGELWGSSYLMLHQLCQDKKKSEWAN